MRSLKELYPLVLISLENNKKEKTYWRGICSAISFLMDDNIITCDEFYKLKDHFTLQKPFKGNIFGIYSKHRKFTKNKSFTGKGYWWEENEEGLNQRIEFIKYLITKV